MSGPDPSREETLSRLSKRADALEARNAPPAPAYAQASSQAYRIIAELIGGVLVGLALGFGFDRWMGSLPWGAITGVLIGFGVSVWMARRTANRLMAQAASEGGLGYSVPFDDEDEDV